MLGASVARQVRQLLASRSLRRLEDGPVGGTPLRLGNDVVGSVVDAPLPSAGGWNLARVADVALAQSAYQLAERGRIWLPGMNESDAQPIPIKRVEAIATIGPYYMDINASTSACGVRGPFEVTDIKPRGAPSYPILWSHDADRERTMCFEAESEGTPKAGRNVEEAEVISEKVAEVAATASHAHFNRDFRFNSQSTAMQFTRRRTIGGRAWLSVQLPSENLDKTLVLWGNISLGLLLYWWHANKQQPGRGSIGRSALAGLDVLDVTALTPDQIGRAARLFDEMCTKELRTIDELEADPVRRELDERIARQVLGSAGVDLRTGGRARPPPYKTGSRTVGPWLALPCLSHAMTFGESG